MNFSQKTKLFFIDTIIVYGCLLAYPLALFLISTNSLYTGKVTQSITLNHFFKTQLGVEFLFFCIVLILLHLFLVLVIRYVSDAFLQTIKVTSKEKRWLSILICFISIWWIYLANGMLYPMSRHANVSRAFNDILTPNFVFYIVTIMLVCLLLNALFQTVRVCIKKLSYSSMLFNLRPGLRSSLLVIAAIGLTLSYVINTNEEIKENSEISTKNKPNIILIGIDSLRPDFIWSDEIEGESNLPNIRNFLTHSKVFETAYTPLARTYPAWNSILTGTYPVKHGARFNLISEIYQNNKIMSIAQLFRKGGYRTIYATDEKRFSNIDERFGFDKVIGPKIGAGDFLLGNLNDLPLTNLISNTWMGKVLFPFTYGNRAATVTYKPETFDRMVIDSLAEEEQMPLFFNIHFCLAHWPYTWSGSRNPEEEVIGMFDGYKTVLQQADKQFGRLITFLKKKGVLDNAIVVVLSDHGESFTHDSVQYKTILDKNNSGVKRVMVPGHGTDVLSRKQYEVLLAFRKFGGNRFMPERSQQHAGLIDIAPTLMDLVQNHSANDQFDGISLRPWLENPEFPLTSRMFFVETGFSVPAIMSASPNEVKAFQQGAEHYTISKQGRILIKDKSIPLLMSKKQYALYFDDLTFSLFPGGGLYDHGKRALVNHETKMWYAPDSAFFKKHIDFYQKIYQQFGLEAE